MGQQIIEQPDGRLCVWSTVTDSIIITATPDELLEHYAEQAAADARRRTRKVIDLVLAGLARKAYFQFTMTYDQAVSRDPLP